MRSPVQIYEFIETILVKNGISDRQMMQESGLKRGVLDNMKKGSMPSADKLAAIASYLGVSVDYLLGREGELLPASEREWLSVLDQMSDEDLKSMKSYAQYLISKQITESKDLEKDLSERVKKNGIQEE